MVRELLKPATVAEALRMKSRPGAAFLGGGTWLNSLGSEAPEVLISLEKLGFDFVEASGERLRLGASATFQEVLDQESTPEAIREAIALTASRTLRNMITIGGELGLRPADSALIPVLIALDAKVGVATRSGLGSLGGPRWRTVGIEEYCRTRMEGLVTEVLVQPRGRVASPRAATRLLCGLRALSRASHSPRSLVVAVNRDGPRIVLSDCRGQLFRLVELEEELAANPLPTRERVEKQVGRVFFPTSDIHASSDYKRYIASVFVADLLGARP